MAGKKKALDDKASAPVGRPTIYSSELIGVICSRMACGESMRTICKDEAMPVMSTVFRWLGEKPEFKEQYAKAMEQRAEYLFEEIIAIADDGQNDTYSVDGQEKTNTDVIARSRLRVDTRKWMLSKMLPKRFGDKVTQEHTGAEGGPVLFSRIERRIIDVEPPKE